MTSTALYNEIDPYAAQWLRNLSDAGHIAHGRVDIRSIADLQPEDVRHATQAHFFAGIGVWSYALRLAGIPDDWNIWSGSCPCQPFSVAGKRRGKADERHLWPEFRRLIAECGPDFVIGEQVSSPDGRAWFDVVQADLEALGYAVGSLDAGAACVGAPHMRQRIYFGATRLGSPSREGLQGRVVGRHGSDQRVAGSSGLDDGVAGNCESVRVQLRQWAQRPCVPEAGRGGSPVWLGDAHDESAGWQRESGALAQTESPNERIEPGLVGHVFESPDAPAAMAIEVTGVDRGATRGFWAGPRWLLSRDGGVRPVSGFPLAVVDGSATRVERVRAERMRKGKLKAYGNAIVAPLAAEFITAFFEAILETA